MQALNGRTKELFGDGKVEDDIALRAVSLIGFGERGAQVVVKLGLAQIALHVRHLVGKAVPSLFVNAAANAAAVRPPGIGFQFFIKIIAPAFGGCVRPGYAD